MKTFKSLSSILPILILLLLSSAGCDDGGKDRLINHDPGGNNLNAIVAFGDSLTQGSSHDTPYPARLALMTGMTVYNEGIKESRATDNIARANYVIQSRRAAYMIILYGVNDVIAGRPTSAILDALADMIQSCRDAHVLPVLATYPIPQGRFAYCAPAVALLNDGIRDLADAKSVRCVNLESEFAIGRDPANPSILLSDASLLAPDGLHPNGLGTELMALTFASLF